MNLIKAPLLALTLTLPVSALAATDTAQDAINSLRGSIAQAELTLSVVEADQVLRDVRTQEAVNRLAYSLVEADLSIAMADANSAIDSVSDQQMLAELEGVISDSALLTAVVQERPALAHDVYGLALQAGYDEAQVASLISNGFGDLPATAAGQ